MFTGYARLEEDQHTVAVSLSFVANTNASAPSINSYGFQRECDTSLHKCVHKK